MCPPEWAERTGCWVEIECVWWAGWSTGFSVGLAGMDSEERALRVKARRTRRASERAATTRLPDGPEAPATASDWRPGAEEYARQAMVSSARAHDRAALLLEEMATVHPEEAELHLQSAARHRRWADNDRKLARQHAPGGSEIDAT